MHADVLEGGTADDGHETIRDGLATDGRLERERVDFAIREEGVGDGVVEVGQCSDEGAARLGGAFAVGVGQRLDRIDEAVFRGAIVENGALVEHVDLSAQFALAPDGNEHGPGVGTQAGAHFRDDACEVRADPVHLVDEGEPRHVVTRGLTPDSFGLRLHALDPGKHGDRAVEHPHGALNLGGKVDVARGVDDVDAMRHADGGLVQPVVAFRRPGAGDGGSTDGDAFALLDGIVIHGGIAVMHITGAMDRARIEKDAFGQRGLAGIDVRSDADVPRTFDRDMTFDGSTVGVVGLGCVHGDSIGCWFGCRHASPLRRESRIRAQKTPLAHFEEAAGRK